MTEPLAHALARFAAHLRDPDRHAPPQDINERRMQVYRELYFNNIQSLLAGNFPVIRRTLGEDRWMALVRAFCREHCPQTPLFSEIAQEFIHFLDTAPSEADAPWLLELAHYEWIELALQISDAPLPAHDPDGDLLAGVPVCSPWYRALAYQWPVHRIGPGYQPVESPPQPTLLLARRDGSSRIVFSELSPLLFLLLERLEAEPTCSGREQLLALAAGALLDADEGFMRDGAAMLQQLRECGCLLGTAVSHG